LRKKFLLFALVPICLLGWYGEPVLRQLGLLKPVVQHNIPSQRPGFIVPDPVPVVKEQVPCMSVQEYAAQAKTNPDAYYRMLYCDDKAGERTEFDKLMNFFTRLKYE